RHSRCCGSRSCCSKGAAARGDRWSEPPSDRSRRSRSTAACETNGHQPSDGLAEPEANGSIASVAYSTSSGYPAQCLLARSFSGSTPPRGGGQGVASQPSTALIHPDWTISAVKGATLYQ